MKFKFAKALTQVCKYCNFLVARTDRNLVKLGQAADLAEIPTPFEVGAEGQWGGQPFYVEGRVQLDRVNAPGAPWQEYFIGFHTTDRWCWVAFAQGRWYSTTEIENPPPLPPYGSLRPGMSIELSGMGTLQVAEVGQRKVIAGEGELPAVAPPDVPTWYADIAGPGGVFGTIDYGDGGSIPTKLYMGRQFDPAEVKLSSGMPLEMPQAEVASCECPNCGGSLPLVAPGTTERLVCKYCGTVSDVGQGGALSALAQAPKPPMEPYVPLGTEGTLRGMQVICIGFVIRGTTGTDGMRYRWREYLLYAGESVGYLWLMEEDGRWSLVTPIPPGEVNVQGYNAQYRGGSYTSAQSNQAQVEYVVGEFYWKVTVGEEVRATEYNGPGGKVSVEEAATEVTYSFVEQMTPAELGQAFNLAPPPAPYQAPSAVLGGFESSSYSSSGGSSMGTVITVIVFLLFGMIAVMDDCGGSSGGVYVGPSYGGK